MRSVAVTLTAGDRTHRVLFNTGVSPDGLIHNMRFLELAPGDVEGVVLSHGHFDPHDRIPSRVGTRFTL